MFSYRVAYNLSTVYLIIQNWNVCLFTIIAILLSVIYVIGTACDAGYYSLGNSTACLACPGGYQCSDPAVEPVICQNGTYAANSSDSCTDCPKGYKYVLNVL